MKFPISGYISGCFLFFGGSFWVLGKHPSRVDQKTAEYVEEIDVLFSEIRSRIDTLNEENRKQAEDSISYLEKFKEMPSETSILRLTPLRKLRVSIYSPNELCAQLVSELEQLKYYSGRADEMYEKYEEKVNALMDKADEPEEYDEELRQYLRIIREEIDNVRYQTGYGEAIIESMVYWIVFSGISLFVIGFSPLFAKSYFTHELSIAHWAVFGLCGALLATTRALRKWDTFYVGEDEGNMLLRQMVMGLFTGSVAAVVLYLAIKSGMLGGKALPRLIDSGENVGGQTTRNALSIFWAVASGFSGGSLIERMLGRAEQTGTST